MPVPRVAFFPDSFLEINGVARTSSALDAFARRRAWPFLTVHAGPALLHEYDESGGRLQLPRGPVALRLESDLRCDLLFWRHARRVRGALAAFRPDVIHVTGPNDLGQLGAALAWRLGIPLVASWHTNVHEFAARRVAASLPLLSAGARESVAAWTERRVLHLASLFYRIPRVVMAPNDDLVRLLEARTRRPVRLMRRGVETDLFTPARRTVRGGVFRIGFVGRLSPEKNVRMLPAIERLLLARDAPAFRFVVVGDGSERAWLARHLQHAEFTGVLRGEALARAYAEMDVFLFPSTTDTFGNAVLEALSSGTPALVTPSGGPRTIIEDGVSGMVANGAAGFAEAVLSLSSDPARHRRMREAARARALDFSWDRTFERVYDAYALALDRRPPGTSRRDTST